VFSPYRSILALPGAKAFTWWGLIARAQMAMTELGILLMVQIEYGSYAVAGRVVAVVAISWAVLAPFVGRLVDRFGQAATLRWGFGIAIVGRVAMVVAAITHQPEWALMACAPLFAASGSISTYTRSRWVHLVRDDDSLNTAFSLESSLDEVLFIAGPAMTTILATQVASWAGPACPPPPSLWAGTRSSLCAKRSRSHWAGRPRRPPSAGVVSAARGSGRTCSSPFPRFSSRP
jgi:MFS family permease